MAATDINDDSSETVQLLRDMRDELQTAFFDSKTPARDKAALSRQLLIVQAQLVAAIGDDEEQQLDRKLTADASEPLDPDSI